MYNVTPSHYWYPNNSCWGHDIWLAKEQSCGWSESWADFFPLLVNRVPGDTCYDKGSGPCTGTRNNNYFALENQGWGDGHPVGLTVEGRVAGALYDLYDSNNEGPFDVATNSFESMWIITRDRVPCAQTLADFGNSWQNSGYDYGQFLLLRPFSLFVVGVCAVCIQEFTSEHGECSSRLGNRPDRLRRTPRRRDSNSGAPLSHRTPTRLAVSPVLTCAG